MTAPAWLDDKACRGADAALFFGGEEERAKALAICGGCPVRPQCRAEAEAQGDISDGYTTHGQVVGGCGPKPRRAGERPMLPCMREDCRAVFAKRTTGPSVYCSRECADIARRTSKRESYERRRGAA